MPISHLLSPPSLPSPPPPLLRNGAPRRCPTPLRAVLALPLPRHLWLAAARGDGGTLGSSRARAVGAVRVSAVPGDGGAVTGGTGIAAAAAATVVFAVMNRVLYKLALVPMKNYPFFLAQFATFGFRAGIVTREMLALPKAQFMLIGLLEALGVASGMASAAMLPGPSIPVLSQSFLVWQLILSVLILGRKYRANQILGCMLVTTGVILAVASGANGGPFLSELNFFLASSNDGFSCISSCCFHYQGVCFH